MKLLKFLLKISNYKIYDNLIKFKIVSHCVIVVIKKIFNTKNMRINGKFNKL